MLTLGVVPPLASNDIVTLGTFTDCDDIKLLFPKLSYPYISV